MSLVAPKIRFKDDHGNDFPDWEEKKLGEVGDFKSGVGFSESEQGGKEGTPFYKVSDMNLPGNETSMKSANHYVSETQISANNYKVISDESLVFAKVGAAIFLERKRVASNFLIDNNMMAFIPSFSIRFAKPLFATIRLSRFVQVGALPSYNASDLRTIKVSIPLSPNEQTKIADFLTAVDRRIEQLTQKKALLEDYKKGVMQQLFTQAIRFKDDDGNDFPDWEEKKLGEVCNIDSGKSKSAFIDENGSNIIVDMGGISKEGKLIAKKRTNSAEDYLSMRDLVMPKDDIGGGLIIGKVAMIPKEYRYICGDHVYKLSVTKGVVAYLHYVINSYDVNLSFRKKANGTAQLGLNKKSVINQTVLFPSLAEQTKIANFLSAIDRKIESVTTQITETQTFKRGLLQQMFV